MNKTWKTIKVFISSTFLDLELERDKLANVFQEIEKKIFKRQLTIRPYDLRWRERHSEVSIVDWCLKMVTECGYFVGILGNRYGWRPNLQNISMTEMEINQAISSNKRRFFCFINEELEEQDISADKISLDALKQRLIASGEVVYKCSDRENLLSIIGQKFLEILDADYPQQTKVEPISYTHQLALDEIIEEKIRGFIGRTDYLQRLRGFAENNDSPNYLGIYAIAGTGKSALLSKFIRSWDRQEIPIIAHFMGMGGNSREIDGVMESLGQQLQTLGIISEKLYVESTQLHNQVRRALQQTTRKLIVAIDGLDEINASNFFWLPLDLPRHVRVILTTRPVETWTSLKSLPVLQPLELPSLTDDEIIVIIDHYNDKHSLNLSPQDRDLLLKRAAGNPLFLKVAFDELVESGIAVGQLAVTIGALFEQIIERLQSDHGKELISDYLGFIAVGRAGITEKDLAEVLKTGDDRLLPVTKALDNFVLTRRQRLIFFHPEFERTIKMRLGKAAMRSYHQTFASYLQQKGYNYIVALDELPYQLQWGEKYQELLLLLTDLMFLQAKSQASLLTGLNNDFYQALNNSAVPFPEKIKLEIQSDLVVSKKTIDLLSKALSRNLQFLIHYPDSLLQSLWNDCYWYDCPQAKEYYLEKKAFSRGLENSIELYQLMKFWQQQAKCENIWLKSLRPMPNRLDSPLLKVLQGHKTPINQIKFSPDNTKIASKSKEGEIIVWDLQKGEILKSFPSQTNLSAIDFIDDSKVVSFSSEGILTLWDIKTGKSLSTFTTEKCQLSTIQSTSETKLLATFSSEATITLEQGQIVRHTSGESTIKLWNLNTGEIIQTLMPKITAECINLNNDGTKIVCGCVDGTIQVWDWKNAQQLGVFSGHENGVESIAFSPDNKRVVSGSKDGTVRVWDIETGKIIYVLRGHTGWVKSVAFNSDGCQIVSGSWDKTIRIWNAQSGELVHVFCGDNGWIESAIFNKDNSQIASGSWDKTIRIWDVFSKEETYALEGHRNWIVALELDPKEEKLVSGSWDKTVKLWDIKNGKVLHSLTGHEAEVTEVGFTADGSKLISQSADEIIKVWDSQTYNLLHSFTKEKYASSGLQIHKKIGANPQHAYRLETDGQETIIIRKSDKKRVATFPVAVTLGYFIANTMFIGCVVNHLYIFEM